MGRFGVFKQDNDHVNRDAALSVNFEWSGRYNRASDRPWNGVPSRPVRGFGSTYCYLAAHVGLGVIQNSVPKSS